MLRDIVRLTFNVMSLAFKDRSVWTHQTHVAEGESTHKRLTICPVLTHTRTYLDAASQEAKTVPNVL